MKVKIITLYKGSFPFIDELLVQLEKKGIEAHVFDMMEMYTLKILNGNSHVEYHVSNSIIKKMATIRFLGTIVKYFFYKRYFRINDILVDHINIHYVLPLYSPFMNYFKEKSKSISTVVWGSDFLRVNDNKRKLMSQIFDNSNTVLIPNTQLGRMVGDYYHCSEKIKNVGFGIGKLEVINRLLDVCDQNYYKAELNIKESKTVITVGYNGLKEQQHLLILNAFDSLSTSIKDNIHIIIPFGYGGDSDYKIALIDKLESLRIDYKVYDTFIADIDVSKIRIATDIVINAQVSDGSSASLQEHLYAKNILLVGNWLKYKHFSDVGIKFWTFEKEQVEKELAYILANVEACKVQVENNDKLIYNLSSWEARIDQWIKVFENKI